jgi:protein-S-isoprenylcysteine O-methyltransferase Ste14
MTESSRREALARPWTGPLHGAAVRWLARRRGLVVALLALAAVALAVSGEDGPLPLSGQGAWLFWAGPWAVAMLGAVMRLWAAGNLDKNREVTCTGAYDLVRHPLYLANSLVYGSFLLALDSSGGALLLMVPLLGLHLSRMLHEEQRLRDEYPEQYARACRTPRLLPDPRRLSQAVRSNRFCWLRAWRNRGWRGFYGPLALPLAVWLIELARTL